MIPFTEIKNAIMKMPPRDGNVYPYASEWTPERLLAMREAPHLQKLLTEIRREAQRAAEEPIPPLAFSLFRAFETDGTRKEYETPYFERRGRLLALTLTSVVDETDRYMGALHDLIWAMCEEFTWCLPAHLPVGVEANRASRRPPEQIVDLFAAETAHALAECVVLLAGRLDPWIEYRVRGEIERRVLRPLFDDPVPFGWESSMMNWSAVCAGAAGMAALLLVDDRERLTAAIDRVVRAMECFLLGYGNDGGCAEGITYWAYGFGYYVYFADMLHTVTAGALDLMNLPKVKRIAAFPAESCFSGTHYPAFSDADGSWMPSPGLLCRLASRLGMPVPELREMPSFHADHCYRWPTVTRNASWTDPSLLGRPVPDGTAVFDDLQWIVDRGHIGGMPTGFAAKGGHNAEPHNHNDLGHFILHAGGEDLLTDLGAGLYTREYFGPQRYSMIHNGSEGHSVPVVDGCPQLAGAARRAEMLVEERHGNGALRIEIDATKAYDVKHLRLWKRKFGWECIPGSDRAALHVRDIFAFDTMPGHLEEVWISRLKPELGDGAVVWRGRQATLALRFEPEWFDAEAERLETLNHAGQPDDVYRVKLRAKRLEREMCFDFDFEITTNVG
jgi:hypothetical protein